MKFNPKSTVWFESRDEAVNFVDDCIQNLHLNPKEAWWLKHLWIDSIKPLSQRGRCCRDDAYSLRAILRSHIKDDCLDEGPVKDIASVLTDHFINLETLETEKDYARN